MQRQTQAATNLKFGTYITPAPKQALPQRPKIMGPSSRCENEPPDYASVANYALNFFSRDSCNIILFPKSLNRLLPAAHVASVIMEPEEGPLSQMQRKNEPIGPSLLNDSDNVRIAPEGTYSLRRRLRSDFSPLPFQELTKYCLPPGRIVAYLNPIFGQELFKSDPLYFGRLRHRRHVVPGEPLVCCLEALPSRNCGSDARFLPFRMSRRFHKLFYLREKYIHEPGDPVVPFGILGPIEAYQQHARCDRFDRLARRQEIRILLARQCRRQIHILQPAVIGDRHQVQRAIFVLKASSKPKYLARAGNICVSLAISNFLESSRVVGSIVKRGGLDIEAGQNHLGRVISHVSLCDDLLALQVKYRFYRLWRDNMQLIVIKLCNISN